MFVGLFHLVLALFSFHGVLFINTGYFFEERLLFFTKVFFIGYFLRLLFFCFSSEGALKFFLRLGKLLFHT